MCGLIWVGGQHSNELAVPALTKMDYRGYDSFGFACLTDAGIEVQRSLESLRGFNHSLPSSRMVLGHTRWATHGSVSLQNCHPHFDPLGRFALAHNGIVSNAHAMSDEFAIGWSPQDDDSDTLVLLKCLGQRLDQGMTSKDAFLDVVAKARGRNTIVCMFEAGEVMAFRLGSPLVLVSFRNGEFGLASDALAFGGDVIACYPLEQGECLVIKDQSVSKLQYQSLDALTEPCEIKHTGDQSRNAQSMWREDDGPIIWQSLELDDIETALVTQSANPAPGEWMKSEILEQWRTIPLQAKDSDFSLELMAMIRSKRYLLVTGAGGAGIVADQIARFIQAYSDQCVIAVSACELTRYASFASQACLLAISQSGETADTIEAIEQAKKTGTPVMSLVNMPLSSMSRLSDLTVKLGAGPEQCVLSTKSATAQLAFGFWLAGELGSDVSSHGRSLQQLGVLLSQRLGEDLFDHFLPAVECLEQATSVYLLGRGLHFATACLGALNLKEATYLHAEAFSAGELKHGVIALVEPGTPVILFGLDEDPYMLGVASELKSRGARVLAIGSPQGDIMVPDISNAHPVGLAISCQILSYLLARKRGINPDRPRNLAKSVTVL